MDQKRIFVTDFNGKKIQTEYFITTNGDVIRNNKVLKSLHEGHGYRCVRLSVNGVYFTRNVHRLVADHFITESGHKQYIRHLNGDKTDNRLENIQILDRSDMKVDRKCNSGVNHHKCKLTEMQVSEILKKGENKYWGMQGDLAKEYQVSNSAISLILSRKNWKHIKD
ncbi:HNH endonuclease [Elizabethkingia anophelis]|uniref:HNH endonuclease n=1 Tax=Elizabethkingia anophelis TaxID=1117645 RepID=UPI0020B7923E|nr:HNH endonuclease [Elizabethkingia anophelis]UTG62443.1 HNH endonuclease [Elizabethkingia anophelis]UXM68727.1 HNH endonuclease [Elizabethkingia anophelis]